MQRQPFFLIFISDNNKKTTPIIVLPPAYSKEQVKEEAKERSVMNRRPSVTVIAIDSWWTRRDLRSTGTGRYTDDDGCDSKEGKCLIRSTNITSSGGRRDD
jgi:hypothetical protein